MFSGMFHTNSNKIRSVALSCPTFCDPLTAACQASLSIINWRSLLSSCPLSRWCYPTISFSVVTFSSSLQSFPASGSFQVSQHFASGWSFSFNISPSNEHSGLISFRIDCWISLQSKGHSRVFSNITVQKHQLFGAKLSL